MKPSQLYTRFRSDVVDVAEPFLWTKDDVWGYMADAQKMFVRLTLGLRDVSSKATRYVVAKGDPWIKLHPSVLLTRSVKLTSTGANLHVFSYEEVVGSNDTPTPFPISVQHLDLAGPLKGVIIGMEEGKLRFTTIPEADDEISLVIERLPLCDPCDGDDGVFEIREEHHLHLLKWMKHLAFLKQDSETLDEKRAEAYRLDFENYCEMALEEKKRRNHKPRLIAYGGL